MAEEPKSAVETVNDYPNSPGSVDLQIDGNPADVADVFEEQGQEAAAKESRIRSGTDPESPVNV